MQVEVYGREGCVQCKYTVKRLEAKGIPHIVKDISELPGAQAGMQLPQVIAGEKRWGGMRPDKIDELVETPKGLV